MDDKLKNMGMPNNLPDILSNFKVELNPNILSGLNNITESTQKMQQILVEDVTIEKRKKEKYKQDILSTLKNIEKNTTGLAEIIGLIQNSNEKQEETYEIITELLALAKEENKEAVESGYKKVMKKITGFTEDVETIVKLTGFATFIYNMLKTGA